MSEIGKTAWLRHDYRRDSLLSIVIGLKAALSEVQEKLETIHWYDGLWAYEESEPIYGLAYIALQNYINKSISDYERVYKVKKPKHTFYQLDSHILEGGRTCVEMIIALANYAKHEEAGRPHENTRLVLDDLQLNYVEPDITESPIFKGLEQVTPEWELDTLCAIVLQWREYIWSSEAFQHQ